MAAEEMRYAADTFFNFDRHTLKPEGKKVLQELVQKVKKLNLEIVITTGYTDSIGTAKYNMRLSERRAHTVKKYLVSLGIAQSKILAEGRGEANPIASNKTSAGRAKNRRVEIEVVGVLR